MAGGGGGGGNFMIGGFLRLLRQQMQRQQRNRGFGSIGEDTINQSFFDRSAMGGSFTPAPPGSPMLQNTQYPGLGNPTNFTQGYVGSSPNRYMGNPTAFQNLNVFGGPGRVTGQGMRTVIGPDGKPQIVRHTGPTAGSQINYAAIDAFNRLPFAQQQMLAQQGFAPSSNDFVVSGPGGTYGRQGGQTLGGQGRKGGPGVAFNAAMLQSQRSAQRGGGQSFLPGGQASGQDPFGLAGNVTQNLDAVINRLGRVNQSAISNKAHRSNLSTQAGLEQLRQRAAASGNMDRFGQIAANFLGSSEQGRRNAMSDQTNTQTSQLLQALGLKTDLMARLAQAVAAAQPGTNSFLGMM